VYGKADGKLYIKDDAGTETDLSSGAVTITVTADTGTDQELGDGDTLTVTGGDGLSTSVGATDEVTIDLALTTLSTATPVGGDILVIYDNSTTSYRRVFVQDLPFLDGDAGSTDNAVPRADGTGGATLQASGITIDDSDNVDGVNDLDVGGEGRFSGDLVSQSNQFVVRAATGGSGGSNPGFYFLNGDYGDTGVTGFIFFFDNFNTGDWQLATAVNGAYGSPLLNLTSGGVLDLRTSSSTPATNGVPRLWNASGSLTVKDGSGTVTTLSPHPQDTLVDTSGRPTTHVYKEYNVYSGRRVELDIYGALAALETETGGQFIYEDEIAWDERENEFTAAIDLWRDELEKELYA
jgi:hypothetical protein